MFCMHYCGRRRLKLLRDRDGRFLEAVTVGIKEVGFD